MHFRFLFASGWSDPELKGCSDQVMVSQTLWTTYFYAKCGIFGVTNNSFHSVIMFF